jgi:tetratricopeptide (TPR) repeat protein
VPWKPPSGRYHASAVPRCCFGGAGVSACLPAVRPAAVGSAELRPRRNRFGCRDTAWWRRRSACPALLLLSAACLLRAQSRIIIDYPRDGSIFPPEITAPTFLWHDDDKAARAWQVEIAFPDGTPAIRVQSAGEPPPAGEIDPRCSWHPDPPSTARAWIPAADTWNAIKRHPQAKITITGFRDANPRHAVSSGTVRIETSRDPVGAPIFYRDVPLMPSELEKGVIKPLAQAAIPLIAWRLRNLAEPKSRVVLEGMHTCANCHSFSRDGKTLGMDLDGPQNDKGLYAISPVRPRMSIGNQDLIAWNSFRDQPAGPMRVGFMSQISPDGRYVVTTVGVEQDLAHNYYVVNFKDYRFLQVFYATRGVLVVYDRATGERHSLPGADDPRYVQTNATWSPDGRYIVFARAEGRDPYPAGAKMAEYANDPNETQIQYDLYRVPFNGGKGGRAEAIAGASANGMSNSFPRVSPDGRWLVFVQARNGLLMRPDSQLYIVPFPGGEARRMLCNTPTMNSWHSFSPDGRWMVFASKARSPYTRMYLTHIDVEGHDSPPILVENTAARNRAVNLPEFVNIPPDGLLSIDVPAAEFYTRFDRAFEVAQKGEWGAAIAAWNEALELNPGDARARSNLGYALAREGKLQEAVAQWNQALAAHEDYPEVHNNMGRAMVQLGRIDEAIRHWYRAIELGVRDAETHYNLGVVLAQRGRLDEATRQFESALAEDPRDAQAHSDLGNVLYSRRRYREALDHWRAALRLKPDDPDLLKRAAWVLATCPDAAVRDGGESVRLASRSAQSREDASALDVLAAAYAESQRFTEAVETARRALTLAGIQSSPALAQGIRARMALYEKRQPFRD